MFILETGGIKGNPCKDVYYVIDWRQNKCNFYELTFEAGGRGAYVTWVEEAVYGQRKERFQGAVEASRLPGDNYLNLSIAGLTDRLIKVVHALLDPAMVCPNPFPVDQQLSDLGLSSLKMVNLMLMVEMEFDIMIPQGEITPENFYSVSSVARLVEKTLTQTAVNQ